MVIGVLAGLSFTSVSDNPGYDIGDIATDFKLKNIDGNMVSLSDYKEAKGFIVIFTCNTCPYAVAYEDRIVALDKNTHPKVTQLLPLCPTILRLNPKTVWSTCRLEQKQKVLRFHI